MGPITVDDICNIHRRLLSATGQVRYAGVLRNRQNWVGGINPCRAEFVPPPTEQVRPLTEDLCAYISGDDHLPLLQAALTPAQFVTIHLFADGNGRTGRALVHLLHRRRGTSPPYVPAISLILATHAPIYVAGLTSNPDGGLAESAGAQTGMLRWLDVFAFDTLRACNDARDLMRKMEEFQC